MIIQLSENVFLLIFKKLFEKLVFWISSLLGKKTLKIPGVSWCAEQFLKQARSAYLQYHDTCYFIYIFGNLSASQINYNKKQSYGYKGLFRFYSDRMSLKYKQQFIENVTIFVPFPRHESKEKLDRDLLKYWNYSNVNVNIKTLIFQASWYNNKIVFRVNSKSTLFQRQISTSI